MSWKIALLLCLPALLVLACSSDADPTPEPTAAAAAPPPPADTPAPEPTNSPVPAEPFVIGAMDALTGVAESYGNPVRDA